MGETVGKNEGAIPARPPTGADVTVTVGSDAPDWQTYTGRHVAATLYHAPDWGAVMKEAYGNRPYYVTACRGGSVVGTLQLVLQKSLLFGTHLCSLPYADAAGILADDAEVAKVLLAEAHRLMQETHASWVELRHEEPLGDSLHDRTDKVTLRLALPPDPDALWNSLSPKVRNQVRKAEREGVEVHDGSLELLNDFHRVYVRNMRDLGSPPHSLRFFRAVADHFSDACRVFVGRLDDQVVGASFTLTDGTGMRVPWAASDWRFRRSNANMLVYRHMLKRACERGCPRFDFGRSTRGSGTHKFKQQWGAEEVPLTWQYLLPQGKGLPEVRPTARSTAF